MRALLFVIVAASVAVAQSSSDAGAGNSAIRVCVAAPSNMSQLAVSPTVQRDYLVHDINSSAQKKNAKVRVEAVAVEGDARDAAADAQDKSCRFLVLSEFRINQGYTAGTDHAPGFDPMIGPRGDVKTRRASLSFRIMRVGGNTRIADGYIGLPEDQNEDSAASDGMRQLSVRVVHEVTKNRPPSLE
jgi:hypothetical protein